MLIPYNTDAPLYHPPIATVVTIVINVLLFIPVFVQNDPYGLETDIIKAFGEEAGVDLSEEIEAKQGIKVCRLLTLEKGCFRPWQWLTANYMHGDIFHLLGNMFVLWGFGLVVEGKVGWLRFTLIYNAIGIAGFAVVALLSITSTYGIALGASLAIFGILMIALIWAPSNEMNCIFLLGFRPIMFEASIMIIAAICLFLQFAISVFHVSRSDSFDAMFSITSEVLHLLGAVFGLVIGVAMVKRKLVDCENFDLFSVMSGKSGDIKSDREKNLANDLERLKQLESKQRNRREQSAEFMPPLQPIAPLQPVATQADILLAQFRQQVASGQTLVAWDTYCRSHKSGTILQLTEPEFVQFISAIRKQQAWELASVAMKEYLRRYSERATTIRLALAQIQIQFLKRPNDAAQILNGLNPAMLAANELAMYQKLVAALRSQSR